MLTGLIKFVVADVGYMLIKFIEFPNLQYILLLIPFGTWIKYVKYLMYGRKLCVSHKTLKYRCPIRNVPDFGRVFLMLKYTDITQNTYVQILNGYGDNGQRSLKV